jgi:hypothetical protein
MQQQSRGQWNEVSIQLKQDGQSADYRLLLASEAVEAWRMRWIEHGGPWQSISVPQT